MKNCFIPFRLWMTHLYLATKCGHQTARFQISNNLTEILLPLSIPLNSTDLEKIQ